MVRYSLIVLVISTVCAAESFTAKRMPRRPSISSLHNELGTTCCHIMQRSPHCIKKIIHTKDKHSSRMVEMIADVQTVSVDIIQSWLNGATSKMTREQLERAIAAAQVIDNALEVCLKTCTEDTCQKLSSASNAFLKTATDAPNNTA